MKQKKMKKKATALLLAVAMIVTSFPQYVKEVYAAAELPDSTKFVTIDELKDFNTNDNDGEKNRQRFILVITISNGGLLGVNRNMD